MKKKLTPLVCGIVILAVLIVLYVVGSARKNKATDTQESAITQDEIGQKLSTNDNAIDILVENENGKYEFEKAKRKNDNDRADYYWDLIRNFIKILESEE